MRKFWNYHDRHPNKMKLIVLMQKNEQIEASTVIVLYMNMKDMNIIYIVSHRL